MFNSKIKSVASALAFIALTACASGISPTIETVDRAALDQAKTYAFLNKEAFMQASPLLPGFPVEDAEGEIRTAIQTEMDEAGYVRVDHEDDPDILVGYMIGINEVAQQYIDTYTGRFGGVRAVSFTDFSHTEGSLVIDLFDTDTGNRIWSGWAKKEFYAPPRGRRDEIIAEAVDAILAGVSGES